MADISNTPTEKAAPKARKPRATTKGRAPTDVAAINTDVPLQMGFWPDEVRGVPNAALRGALFSINQERELAKKRQKLATVDGYQIVFKGERYNQRDLDLWKCYYTSAGSRPMASTSSSSLVTYSRRWGGLLAAPITKN